MKNFLKHSFALFSIILLVFYSETASSSAAKCFDICIETLMPSLFPFFVLSKIFIDSGGDLVLAKIFKSIMVPLFKINSIGASAFILGLISGYPIGSKVAVEIYNQGLISKKEADNLICFSNNSGPLFIIGALGVGMFSSKKIGVFLYIIHILSAITLGFALRFTLPKPKTKADIIPSKKQNQNIFTNAVEGGMQSLIKVFAYVIFFGIITDILNGAGVFTPATAFFGIFGIESDISVALSSAVLEITSGIKKLSVAKATLSFKIITVSFLLGWSGFSIHFQTKSVLDGFDFPFKKYLISKFLQGITASIYAFLAIKLFPTEKAVFLSTHDFYCQNFLPYNFSALTTIITLGVYIIKQLRLKHSSRY